MVCQEKDVNNDYIATRCDLAMLLRNIGRKGELKLVTVTFFDWGMKAMGFIARELIVEDITTK